MNGVLTVLEKAPLMAVHAFSFANLMRTSNGVCALIQL
jgi:hypothetical protein